MQSATSRDAWPVTLELFPVEGPASDRRAATVERASTEARGQGNGTREDGAQHNEALAQHAAKVRARQNRRRAILDFFAARPGWRISSAELHQRFGSAFRSRVSEINRDPEAPLHILNHSAPVGDAGEVSHYWAEPGPLLGAEGWRGLEGNDPAAGRQSVGGVAGVERDTGQGNGSASGTQAEHIGASTGRQAEARSVAAVVVDRAAECSPACRCFCHSFGGPGGVPCIVCP